MPSQPKEEDRTKEIAGYTKRVKRTKEDTLSIPEDLPVEEILLDLSEEEKKSLKQIGEEVSCKLAHKPGSYYIKKYIRPKYAYPQEEKGIAIAQMPDGILPKCKADSRDFLSWEFVALQS